MNNKDAVTKKYISNNEIFADAFNYLIYDGKQVIKPSQLKPLDATLFDLPFSKNGGKVAVQKLRDVVKAYAVMTDGDFIYYVLGAENQSEIHYAMPVRNMGYDYLEYSRQVTDITSKNKKEKNFKSNGEFLSGMKKTDKLMPVITLVIYFGADEWDAPTSIHQMLNVKDRSILKYVSDYKINLIAPNQMTEKDFAKLNTSLREVLTFIKFSNDEAKLNSALANNERFKNVDLDAANVINVCTNSDFEINENERVVNMCKAIQDIRTGERTKGKAEGRAEGKAEGREELIKNAYDMLKDVDKVAEILKLSKEYVRNALGQ